jgi:hypothetical protein
LCFCWYYLFGILWYWQCNPCFYSSHTFSHNIATFLCWCNVDYFIPAIIILTYDYKPTLNRIV